MILDGNVEIHGDAARGARFNSTLRYVKTCKEKGMTVMGIVLSEDGMLNIFSTKDTEERFDNAGY